MYSIKRRNLMLVVAVLACSGCAAVKPPTVLPPPPAVAPAPLAPVAPAPNMCDFLGVTTAVGAGKGCVQKVCICLQRQFPAAMGPPDLGPVAHDASPAVACAAEILAEEAKAPQKIDAIRYLGTIGCSKCYDCVENGLLAALDDCTEEVRFEAAKALRKASTSKCQCCQSTSNSCCTQKVINKLRKVAFESDDTGNPIEPSPRVRRVARQIIAACGTPLPEPAVEPTPAEGPRGGDEPPPIPLPPAPGSPVAGDASVKVEKPTTTPPTPSTTTSSDKSEPPKGEPVIVTDADKKLTDTAPLPLKLAASPVLAPTPGTLATRGPVLSPAPGESGNAPFNPFKTGSMSSQGSLPPGGQNGVPARYQGASAKELNERYIVRP